MSTGSSTVEALVAGEEVVQPDGVVEQPSNVDAPETGKPAESSSAEDSGAKGPATALEAVKAALGAKPAADSPPQAEDPGKAGVVASAPETLTPDAQAAADKLLPFHNHPRWKEVTTAAKALESQVTELSPKAQRWDAIDARFRETGLAPDDVQPLFEGGASLKRAGATSTEVADLMKVGAALKLGDRQVVQQIAGPIFEALGLQLVETLPAEIAEMVESGAMTEDAGRKMAGLQFNVRAEATRRGIAEKQVEQVTETDKAAAQEAEFTRASASWESRVKSTDADWSRKEPFIVEAIRSRVRLQEPTSPEEVVQICQDSYDQVTRIMKGSGGQRATVRPAVGGGSTTVKVAPRNPLEAVRAGLGAA
jgi:hypothetical protein